MERYLWREAGEGDLGGLEALDSACLEVDGPASVVWATYPELLKAENAAMLCASRVAAGVGIVAVGWAKLSGDNALLGGKVHPEHRRKGLGTHVLRWTEERAKELDRPDTLRIRNEAINEGSAALYAQEGYTRDFAEQWMQRDLREALPRLDRSFDTAPWTPENAKDHFAAYVEAFRERFSPGRAEPDAEEWIRGNTEDPDFRPDLSLVAYDDGQPIGFLTAGVLEVTQLGRTVGWISQVGSHPAWRGRGVAASMMVTAMARFKSEGLEEVGLHVNVDNPRAILVYERLGFNLVGTRAMYSKPAR